MKPIKTLFLFFSIIVVAHGHAQTAAKPLQFSIGGDLGLSNNFSQFVTGAEARIEQQAGKHFSWMLTGGYTQFSSPFARRIVTSGMIADVTYDHTGLIPVKAGLKFFINPTFYFSGEIGAGFIVSSPVRSTTYLSMGTTAPPSTDRPNAFVYAPSIGMKAGKKWDLSLKFEDFTNFNSQVAFRAGYRLN